jgi:hypothetical protein
MSDFDKHLQESDAFKMLEIIEKEMHMFTAYCNKWQRHTFGMSLGNAHYTYMEYANMLSKKRREASKRILKKIVLALA